MQRSTCLCVYVKKKEKRTYLKFYNCYVYLGHSRTRFPLPLSVFWSVVYRNVNRKDHVPFGTQEISKLK